MYFFDTYAIIELIKENKSYKKYNEEIIITSVLNLGELYYALLKDFGKEKADEWKNKLESAVLHIDTEIITDAMLFKYKNKGKNFSFIDCAGYILAREYGLKFLTGDKEFKYLPNVEFAK